MNKILAYVGVYGPLLNLIIYILVEVFNILNDEISLIYFIMSLLLQIISPIMNHVLKVLIKQPRPKGAKDIDKYEKRLDKGSLGMPSGHAQMHSSIITLAYYSNFPFYIICIMVLFLIISLFQRFTFKKHTISQLLVGVIVGFILTHGYWYFILKPIQINFKNKKLKDKNLLNLEEGSHPPSLCDDRDCSRFSPRDDGGP
jgi:membrane-associated phospholipid phosphatase